MDRGAISIRRGESPEVSNGEQFGSFVIKRQLLLCPWSQKTGKSEISTTSARKGNLVGKNASKHAATDIAVLLHFSPIPHRKSRKTPDGDSPMKNESIHHRCLP